MSMDSASKMPQVQNKSATAAIVAGVAAVVGAGITSLVNYYSNRRTNEENREIAKENNQFNQSLWNQTNEYNTPSNQVQRLRDAGMNPGLMYGMPPNIAQMGHKADETGKQMPFQISGFDDAISNAGQMYLQSKLNQSQIAKINADTEKQTLDNLEKKESMPYWKQDALNRSKILEASLDKINAELFNINQDTLNKEFTGRQLEMNIDYLERTFKARVQTTVNAWKQSDKDLKLTDSQITEYEIRAKLLAEQIISEKVKRSDIIERLNLYKDYTKEQIEAARTKNKVDNINLSNYKLLRGEPDKRTPYGYVMTLVDDLLGSVGSLFSKINAVK